MMSNVWWQPFVALLRGRQSVSKWLEGAATRTGVLKERRSRSSAGPSPSFGDDSGSFSGLAGTSSQRSLQLRVSASAHPFHAVSVVPGAQACQAVYVFTGQRFLSRNAPRLPVAGCNSRFCTCKFKHHKDRRVGPRRRSDFGFGPALWRGVERRMRHGRRTEDF